MRVVHSLIHRLTGRWRSVVSGSGGTQAGSVTVEMVFVAPLLVAMLLLVVFCGRLVTAQLDVDAAAHSAARAASLAHSPGGAQAAARKVALETLASRGVTCPTPIVDVDTSGLQAGGVVTARITCGVPLSDLGLIGLGGTRAVSAESSSPVDRWAGGR